MADKTFNDVKINITLKPQETRANLLSTREDLAVQMGKIQKWYTDLRQEAFDGTSRNDLLVQTKTFTDFIGNTQFYFGSCRQTNWNAPMLLRYRIKVWVPANENYVSYADVLLTVLAGASAYNTTESVKNTGYRPVYYHYWGRATSTGYNTSYGNIIGIGLNDSTNNTSTSLKRSCIVEILECINGTFTFFDNILSYDRVPGYGADPANYSIVNGPFSGNGTYPDSNNYDRLMTDQRLKAGTNGAKQYSMMGINSNKQFESFVTSSGTSTTKSYYTAGKFLYKQQIFYYAKNGNTASGSVIDGWAAYDALRGIDFRYSAPGITTSSGLTAWTPVYLEISFDSDGYWSVTTNGFTQTLRTGCYYIWIGVAISVYQVSLGSFHPTFYYDGSKLIDADKKFAQDAVPADNVTGTGQSGKIAMFNGTHTLTTGTVSTGTIKETSCGISDGVLSFSQEDKTAVTGISIDLS